MLSLISQEATVPRNIVEIEDQLQTLRVARGRLALRMRATANELRQGQLTLPDDLDSEVVAYQTSYESLRSDLALEHSLDSEHRPVVAWTQYEDRVAVLQRAASAGDRISAISDIAVEVGTDPTLLNPVREVLWSVEARLTFEPWNESALIDQIESGEHPLMTLRQFVQTREHLSDDDWARSVEFLTTEYGSKLATAIVRGRVVCASRIPNVDSND